MTAVLHMCRLFESSILRPSTSSSRVTSESGTAFGAGEPARNTSSGVALPDEWREASAAVS
jgi:hypothetical protein